MSTCLRILHGSYWPSHSIATTSTFLCQTIATHRLVDEDWEYSWYSLIDWDTLREGYSMLLDIEVKWRITRRNLSQFFWPKLIHAHEAHPGWRSLIWTGGNIKANRYPGCHSLPVPATWQCGFWENKPGFGNLSSRQPKRLKSCHPANWPYLVPPPIHLNACVGLNLATTRKCFWTKLSFFHPMIHLTCSTT